MSFVIYRKWRSKKDYLTGFAHNGMPQWGAHIAALLYSKYQANKTRCYLAKTYSYEARSERAFR